MGFSDRLRAWFRGESGTSARRAAPEMSQSSRQGLRELEDFASQHEGVEGFIEPATTIYPTTLLLVAGTGQYLRRPVGTRERAQKLASKLGIPVYDAARVGYPQRMRDWDRGVRADGVSLADLPPWPGDDE